MDLCSLNYTEERAEDIKKSIGNAMPQEGTKRRNAGDGIDYTEVNNYVHARADEIVANIMAQPEYAGMRDTDLPGGIVIVGGGSRLRGFNELLSQQSKMKVRIGAPTAAVRISDGAVHGSDAVDVISIVVAAADMPGSECVTHVEEVEEENPRNGYDGMYSDENDDHEEESRIGRMDDDFSEDINEKKRKEKEKAKAKEKEKKKGPSFIDNIRQRISNMLSDTSDWEADE